MKIFERVHFRLIQTPCCNTLLCCVNPRFYTYCPECGKMIFPTIKGGVLISDPNAKLTYNDSSVGPPSASAAAPDLTKPK